MMETSFMYITFDCNLQLHSLFSEAFYSVFKGQLQYGYEIIHFNLIFAYSILATEYVVMTTLINM